MRGMWSVMVSFAVGGHPVRAPALLTALIEPLRISRLHTGRHPRRSLAPDSDGPRKTPLDSGSSACHDRAPSAGSGRRPRSDLYHRWEAGVPRHQQLRAGSLQGPTLALGGERQVRRRDDVRRPHLRRCTPDPREVLYRPQIRGLLRATSSYMPPKTEAGAPIGGPVRRSSTWSSRGSPTSRSATPRSSRRDQGHAHAGRPHNTGRRRGPPS
jgi:hypothetical protein